MSRTPDTRERQPERQRSPGERETLERSANRMGLVERWSDDLAHEIKNPLHAMVINLELVKRRAAGGDAEPAVQRAEVVEAELHRVHALVESMLRLVRPWPQHDSADVQQVFEHLLPVIIARCRIRKIVFDHEPGAGRVPMPPGDLAQALLNLIDNAIEATPPEGSLKTRCTAAEGTVRISVTDSGGGLPDGLARGGALPDLAPDGAPSDLEPDAAPPDPEDSSGRTGLGLRVTQRLVHRAGGRLHLRSSDAGSGTTALLELPGAGSA